MSLDCPFEKVILSGKYGCARSERFALGERIGVACTSPVARQNCVTLLSLLRERARFRLGMASTTAPWPFGKERRLMLGALDGIERSLAQRDERVPRAQDIHALVQQAQETFGSLAALPFRDIVGAIAADEPGRRG